MRTWDWERIMRNKDQKGAKELVNKLANIRKKHGESFNKFAEAIDYPNTSVWRQNETGEQIVNPHFRRILVELKILAISGKTLFDV